MELCLPIRNDDTTWQQLADQLTLARRENRIAVLLIAVSALSLLDFILTLNQMKTVGMAEANPLVVNLMKMMPSAWALGGLKGISLGTFLMLLHLTRHSLTGEIGAWVGLAIMIGVTVMWGMYLQIDLTSGMAEMPATVIEGWVLLN